MNALGDFQTPSELAHRVIAACRERGFAARRILEPTCGSGAFLAAAAAGFPQAAELLGVEIQFERYAGALAALRAVEPRVEVRYADVYGIDFSALPWRSAGPLLVVGNPPWVTAAALGRLGADAPQPPRSNVKGLSGLAARTGAANFDVAEFLVLKLLRELRAQPVQLALLLKESVARKVIDAAAHLALGITSAQIVRIDARKWFGASIDACCLLLSTLPAGTLREPVEVRAGFGGDVIATFRPAALSAPVPRSFIFRQGIKHDAADVFELRQLSGIWRNGYNEAVDVEPEYVYPLRKARALHAGRIEPTGLIVTQRRLGAPTDVLATQAPRLWRYLHTHAQRLAARKSSIYRHAPPFALFGIGAYSFAPWKVGVAGFYAEPRFRLIEPQAGRPVMLGDTAYFVPFESEAAARDFAVLCESAALGAELRARIVRGKRPVTKALLDALDWTAVAIAAAVEDSPGKRRGPLNGAHLS